MKSLFFLVLIIGLFVSGYYLYQKMEKIESYLSMSSSQKEYRTSKTLRKHDITPQSGTLPPSNVRDINLLKPQHISTSILIRINHKCAQTLDKEAREERRSLHGQIEYILKAHAEKSKFFKISEENYVMPQVGASLVADFQGETVAQTTDASTGILIQLDNQYTQALAKEAKEFLRSLPNHIEYILSEHAKQSKFYQTKGSRKSKFNKNK